MPAPTNLGVAPGAFQDPILLPSAPASGDRLSQRPQLGDAIETLDQFQVFHQRDRPKTTNPVIEPTVDQQSLIPIGLMQPMAAQGHPLLHHPEHRVGALDA